jgi:3-deoxy-D-manno-octulosonic-acid transferase
VTRPARRRFPPDGRLVAYEAAVLASAPVALAHVARKMLRDPLGHAHEADPERWTCRARTGRGAPPPPPPPRAVRVAFVGTGFGELRIVERVAAALRARRPEVAATWSFQGREPTRAAAAAHPDQPLAPMPFDFALPVHAWLRNVAPDVVVIVEKFWYPVLARAAAGAGAAVCAIHARPWRAPPRGPFAAAEAARRRWLAGAFRLFCFQSEAGAAAAKPWLPAGADVRVAGNLKFDLTAPSALPPDASGSASAAEWIRAASGGRPVVAAGSTRPGDEEFVLAAWREVAREVPCALLLAPRQVARADEVAALAERAGARVSRRSAAAGGSGGGAPADVLLLDTMGELSAAYGRVAAAFVGGTIAHLGHNVLEPLAHGVSVAYGPAPGHFADEQAACEAAGVGTCVRTPAELATLWLHVLRDPARRDDVRSRAAALLASGRGALDRTVDALAQVVDEASLSRQPPAPTSR